MEQPLLRIGHKGADKIAPGNTLASFAAAVDAGVEIVELDVLRPPADFAPREDWRDAEGGPARASGPLLVAHDWGIASRTSPPTLEEALDAFREPPLDRVEIDLDLKVAGREDEVVAALRERGLLGRAMVSGMELPGLRWIAANEPDVRLGWTVPRITRDWRRRRWARPVVLAWMAWSRWRLPARVEHEAPKLGAWAVWIYHPLVTPRLIAAADRAGVAVIAWTVDSPATMRRLVAQGVDGIVTNDPRLFSQLES